MEENNKVSVIIPVYNVEDYLERCLDSVINQTYKNLEIIVVDDGSTDNSGEICDEYDKKDSRIIVIHKDNGGVSSARNQGMDICTGDYIAFVDSDDYIHPTTYYTCMNIMLKEELDYIEFEYKKVDKTEIFDILPPINLEFHNSKEVLSGRINWKKHYCSSVNKLFNKKFINNFRFPSIEIGEDDYLFNEYAFKINKVAYVPLNFYYYFNRGNSAMNSEFTLVHAKALNLRIDFYNKLKPIHFDLSMSQLKIIVYHFYLDFKKVTENKNDNDYSRRLMLIKIFIMVYDDLYTSNLLTLNQKQDLILAKDNPKKLIEKYEKGIVRK